MQKPLRVSQLNEYIARIISTDTLLTDVSVTGEISGVSTAASGHVYFSLKDETSIVRCTLFSNVAQTVDVKPVEGMQIVCDGDVRVYQKGGSYSIHVRAIRKEGAGALAIAFEELKAKLKAKGYFDEGRKKPLPLFPLNIALVTSNTGAAVEDMLKIITGKNSVASVMVYPTLVQGPAAAKNIAAQIREANMAEPRADVLIVGRGGGSAEDLWAFNEEEVADAVFASEIPIISAVGHEIDFTICDFVADVRAETPTAAAQMAVPDTSELRYAVDDLCESLKTGLSRKVDLLEARLGANDMAGLRARLEKRIGSAGSSVDAYWTQLRSAVSRKTFEAEQRILRYSEKLESLNPLAVLSRGYALVEGADGKVVSKGAALAAGDDVGLVFADARRKAKVIN